MNAQEKFARLLGDKGWSQTVLAARAGLKPRTVAYIVAGEREPGVSSAIKIAAALGVPVDWLFDDRRGGPPPGPFDIASVPDAFVIEEVIRRRWALRRALEDSVRQIEETTAAIEQVLCQESPGKREIEKLQYLTGRAATALILEHSVWPWERFADRMKEAQLTPEFQKRMLAAPKKLSAMAREVTARFGSTSAVDAQAAQDGASRKRRPVQKHRKAGSP